METMQQVRQSVISVALTTARNLKQGFPDQSGKTTFLSSYQMLLRMKKSWMKMQPKGRIPPITIPGIGLVKKDCSGI